MALCGQKYLYNGGTDMSLGKKFLVLDGSCQKGSGLKFTAYNTAIITRVFENCHGTCIFTTSQTIICVNDFFKLSFSCFRADGVALS